MEKKIILTINDAVEDCAEKFKTIFKAESVSRSENRLLTSYGEKVSIARIGDIIDADRLPAPSAVFFKDKLIPADDSQNLAEAIFLASEATGASMVSLWEVQFNHQS